VADLLFRQIIGQKQQHALEAKKVLSKSIPLRERRSHLKNPHKAQTLFQDGPAGPSVYLLLFMAPARRGKHYHTKSLYVPLESITLEIFYFIIIILSLVCGALSGPSA
jgi:hypothetical protein